MTVVTRTQFSGLLCCLAWGLMASPAAAQNPQPSRGQHHFMIEERANGQIVQRGVTGTNAVAFDNLILQPQTNYRAFIIRDSDFLIGYVDFTTPIAGRRLVLPRIALGQSIAGDADADQLPDDVERVLGTNPNNNDSDSDGVLDGAELQQGTDPLSGTISSTGIAFGVNTSGFAQDICALNDFVVTANGNSGVAIFNVFAGMEPRIIGVIDTPGQATRVACSGMQIAVVDGAGGLAIIDLNGLPNLAINRTVSITDFGATPISVAASAGVAYVGLSNGQVAIVDLARGSVISTRTVATTAISDIALEGTKVYALTSQSLFRSEMSLIQLDFNQSVPHLGIQTRRLAVGGGVAYVPSLNNYRTIDVSQPAAMTLVASTATSQRGWRQVVLNGSGRAAIAVGPNQGGPFDIGLYDVTDINNNNSLISAFPTPGSVEALTIFNGLAYVAAGNNGLQVVNYQLIDNQGVPPTVAITPLNVTNQRVEEGTLLTITAAVTDDVQVRNVEFTVDGQRTVTDGSFPFETRILVPTLAQQSSITLGARASDTGGNIAIASPVVLTIDLETSPPQLLGFVPSSGFSTARQSVSLIFSEALAANTVNSTNIVANFAGPDNTFNTADDQVLTPQVSYDVQQFAVVLTFANPLGEGIYRFDVTPGLTDLNGNASASTVSRQLVIYNTTGQDSDMDGLPDSFEMAVGTNPNSADSDNDLIPDGLEDDDNDGLGLLGELLLNFNPMLADSDGDGINDGDEDNDGDTISNGQEISLGLNPRSVDSDGDSFTDGDEISLGSNASDPNSKPILTVRSARVSFVNAAETMQQKMRTVHTRISFLNTAESAQQKQRTISTRISFLNTTESAEQKQRVVISTRVSFYNGAQPTASPRSAVSKPASFNNQ